MTTKNEMKPADPAEAPDSGRCAVDAGFGNSREKRLARIKNAEEQGFKRCEPYACIGVKKPRWYWNGGYYDFNELPLLPNPEMSHTGALPDTK